LEVQGTGGALVRGRPPAKVDERQEETAGGMDNLPVARNQKDCGDQATLRKSKQSHRNASEKLRLHGGIRGILVGEGPHFDEGRDGPINYGHEEMRQGKVNLKEEMVLPPEEIKMLKRLAERFEVLDHKST